MMPPHHAAPRGKSRQAAHAAGRSDVREGKLSLGPRWLSTRCPKSRTLRDSFTTSRRSISERGASRARPVFLTPRRLLREPRELLAARRQRIARHVHLRGEKHVVAADAGDIDHAALAELLQRALVRRVGDAPVAVQLHAEVVDDLLILAHSHGSTAVADGLEYLRLDPRLQRDG